MCQQGTSRRGLLWMVIAGENTGDGRVGVAGLGVENTQNGRGLAKHVTLSDF